MELGYFIENTVFTVQECDELIESLAFLSSASNSKRKRAGARHLMSNLRISTLANEPRLIKIASHGLGMPVIPFRATLFDKSIKSNWLVSWHQDTALPLVSVFDSDEWTSWSIKSGICYAHAPTWALSRVIALRLHLDDSTSDNGSLKIIPKSHLWGVLTDEEVFNYSKTKEFVECVVNKGGVLAMSPLTIHSSSKAQSNKPRRVLHIEYSNSLELGVGIRLAIA
jgi:hypothetical protein